MIVGKRLTISPLAIDDRGPRGEGRGDRGPRREREGGENEGNAPEFAPAFLTGGNDED